MKLIPWIVGVCGLYVAYLGLLYLMQSSMLYPGAASRERPPLPEDRADREVIWLETSVGRVEAWLLPPRRRAMAAGPVPAVIIGHGNAELIDSMPEGFLREILQLSRQCLG